MRLKFSDSAVEYTSVCYELSDQVFLIGDSTAENTIICRPKIKVINEYDPSNFRMYFLCNERGDCTENSIFQVYVKNIEEEDQRIGWVFPLQALMSSSHDYADNKYFLKYAYIAYYLLLQKIESWNEKELTEELQLTDYHSDASQILLIDQDNLQRVPDFSIDDYIVSLFYNGYSFEGRGNLVFGTRYDDKKRLNLKKIAKELRTKDLIPILFKTSIIKEYNAEFSRFYAYYQIIEMLIAVVFDIEFNSLVGNIQSKTSDLFNERDNLLDLVNEKHRVKKLFGIYSKISGSLDTKLNEKASIFLRDNGKKVGESSAENLYTARCMLVHELYKTSSNNASSLKELNDYFLEAIIELLFTFENPYKQEV